MQEPHAQDELRQIIRLVRTNDELADELRRALLSDELLKLPERFAEFTTSAIRTFGAFHQDLTALRRDLGVGREELGVVRRDVGVVREELGVVRHDVGVVREELGVLRRDVGVVREDLGALKASVTALAGESSDLRSEFGKFAERLGEVSEDGADAVLVTVLSEKGYRLLGDPSPVDLGHDEVDSAVAFDDGSGARTAVVEAKFRLRASHVQDFARRLATPGWAGTMARAGFRLPWVPYVYGGRVYADALAAAKSAGIGVLGPGGERRAPSGAVS